jgi:hypothetical protein
MGEEEKPFRFLADTEFLALSTKQKAMYLVRAQQELEERQRKLREQVKELVKKQQLGPR